MTVNQQRVWATKSIAVVVEVTEKPQSTGDERGGLIFVGAIESRDVVVDELRSRRVVTHDDEAGRDLDSILLPEFKGLLVVPVESFEGGL